MDTILLVAQIIIVLSLVITILLQRNASDGLAGLGGGSGGGSGILSSRGKANLLTRATSFLATLFIVNSLALAWLASYESDSSIIQQYEENNPAPAHTVDIPTMDSSLPEEAIDVEPEVPLGD